MKLILKGDYSVKKISKELDIHYNSLYTMVKIWKYSKKHSQDTKAPFSILNSYKKYSLSKETWNPKKNTKNSWKKKLETQKNTKNSWKKKLETPKNAKNSWKKKLEAPNT